MRNIKWSVSVVCRRLSTKGLFFSGSKFPNPRWKPGCRCCVRGLPLKSAEATYCQLVIRELFSASEVFFSPANGFIKSTVITFVFVCVKPPVSDHSRWPRASVQTQLPPNRAASGLVSKKTKQNRNLSFCDGPKDFVSSDNLFTNKQTRWQNQHTEHGHVLLAVQVPVAPVGSVAVQRGVFFVVVSRLSSKGVNHSYVAPGIEWKHTHTHRAVLHHIRRQINHSITTTTTETFIFLKLLHSGVTTRGHLPPSHPAELFKLKP